MWARRCAAAYDVANLFATREAKKSWYLLTTDDASVDAVLATDADTRVEHDSDQEPSLAVGEALLSHGADTLGSRHDSSSSASRGSTPRPLRPVVRRPPRRAPEAR